jgi:hypothetical protein
MAIGSQSRGEFLAQRDVQSFADLSAELRFDALAELKDRDLACVGLLHGVYLRRRSHGDLLRSAGGHAMFLFPQDSEHIALGLIQRFVISD